MVNSVVTSSSEKPSFHEKNPPLTVSLPKSVRPIRSGAVRWPSSSKLRASAFSSDTPLLSVMTRCVTTRPLANGASS